MKTNKYDTLIIALKAKLLELNRKAEINFSEFLNLLNTADTSFSVKLQNYPALFHLSRALKIEATIDFKKSNEERDKLIARLSKTVQLEDLQQLVMLSLQFKGNQITPATFHEYLMSLVDLYQLDRNEIANLEAYSEYVAIYEAVNLDQALSELKTLASEIIQQLEESIP